MLLGSPHASAIHLAAALGVPVAADRPPVAIPACLSPPGHLTEVIKELGADVRLVAIPVELCDALVPHPSVFAVGPLLREALLALLDPGRSRGAYERLRAVVVDELAETPEQSLHLPEPRDDRLRSVTDLMHADPARPETLAELGRRAGASERTLSRLFRSELGMSFHRWRTILRIHHALIHLTGGRSVTDTATVCGWSNPSSFIDAFTEVVGQTPGRYQAGLG